MKPIIAVVCYTDLNRYGYHSHILPISYTTAIEEAGGIPYIVPFTRNPGLLQETLSFAHGVLFTGGIDIDPLRYGEKTTEKCGTTNSELDEYQFTAFRITAADNKPILAICRGAQLVNVALGGTLHQDIFSELPGPLHTHAGANLEPGSPHPVLIETESQLYRLFGPTATVNSRHHQAINILGEGLRITARATDGIIEGAEHLELPITLVQWHPEMMISHPDQPMLPLFTSLVEKASAIEYRKIA